MKVNIILLFLIIIAVTVFAVSNSEVVAVNLLFTQVAISQALVIFISVALGGLMVFLLALIQEFKLKRKLKSKDKEINKLEKKVKKLELELEGVHQLNLELKNSRIEEVAATEEPVGVKEEILKVEKVQEAEEIKASKEE